MSEHPLTAPPRRIAGLGAVASGYDLLLSDIWGVVHNGREHFPAAVDALRRFRAGGGRVVLLTNAPRPHGSVIGQLDGLAVPRDAYDGVVTSGDVAAALILERGGAPLLHLGPDRDLALYDEVERASGRAQPRVAAEEAEFCVCTGLFDDTIETPDDYAATFAIMRARQTPMICANPDIVVHRGEDEVFCAGALAARYAELGGTVIQAGKPYAPIYAMALRAAGVAPPKARIAAIGDAMATDIRGALDLGVDAIFVTGGIHREALRPGPDAETRAARFYAEAGFAPQMTLPALVW
jgi:HAD superfamily hydrolase (TIGR01459 family)